MCRPTTKRNRHKSNRCGRAYVNHYNYSKADYNRDMQVEVTEEETIVTMEPKVETPKVHAKVTEHQDYSRVDIEQETVNENQNSTLETVFGVLLLTAIGISACVNIYKGIKNIKDIINVIKR